MEPRSPMESLLVRLAITFLTVLSVLVASGMAAGAHADVRAVRGEHLLLAPRTHDYDLGSNPSFDAVDDPGPSTPHVWPLDGASGTPPVSSSELQAPRTTGVLVEGAGSGTRTINFRPTTDANWGLTRAHLDKHLFGSGPTSLRQIDAAGNPDLWRNYIQDLAGRPATATLKGGIQDVIGTFPRADGSGTFQFGIRIAPGPNGSWDLVTLLTRQ